MDNQNYAVEKTLMQTDVRLNINTYQLSVTNYRLAFVPYEAAGISPFSYYYEYIAEFGPVQSGYGEPCILLAIRYSNGMTDRIQIIFSSPAERDSAVSAIYHAYSDRLREKDMDTEPPLRGGHVNSSSGSGQYGAPARERAPPVKTREDYPDMSHESDYMGGGYLSFFEKFSGLIKDPAGTFISLYNDEFSDGLKFMIVITVISAVINTLLTAFLASKILPGLETFSGLGSNLSSLVLLIIEVFIFLALMLTVYGLLSFALSRAFGSDTLPGDSMKVTMFSSVPFAVIGLVPFFGFFLAPLWTIFLQYRGSEYCNEMEGKAAAASSILAAIILAVLFYFIVISGKVGFQ